MSEHTVTIDQAPAADRLPVDLSVEGHDQPVRRISRVRVLTVATVVLLIAASFVLGRVTSNRSGGEHAKPAQTSTAAQRLQAQRQAQARLVQGNGAELSTPGQTDAAAQRLQAQRQAQARLVQGNGAEISSAGHSVLTGCRPLAPC